MAETRSSRFVGYPQPVKAPEIPYHKQDDANPVISGTPLVFGAWLVSRLGFVQRYLFANAGFTGLRGLAHLKDITARSDPTVIPITSESIVETSVADSLPVEPEDSPGRYRSIEEYHQLYLSGRLTPLTVAEYLLPLCRRDVESRSPHSTAFIDSNHEAILLAAKASTARYQAGKPLSVMDGVPTAIKDDSDVKGYWTTQGRKLNDAQPLLAESSWPVQKIEEAGGIIMGKLNMHELGADTTGNNPNWGTPLNPHNPQYYTGGSSSGPAYVVSSGLLPFTIGSDGGGSIRIPSSFCGIYGLKPSHNRLDNTASTVTVNGPIAANMSSLETAYRIIASPNPSDPVASLFKPPYRPATPAPKVIGIYRPWFNRADSSVLNVCNEAVAHYWSIGYKVIDITLPYVPEGQLAHAVTILSEMANGAREKPHSATDWLSGLNAANQALLAVADQTPAHDYLLCQQLRNMLMQHLAHLFTTHQGLLIVTPTSPMAGWPISDPSDLKHGITDGNKSIRNMEYVWLANFCGNPAISCPVGYVEPVKGEGQIPVGLMAMGEWGAEEQLLRWGWEAEEYLKTAGRSGPENWVDVVEGAMSGKIAKEHDV